MSTASNRLKLLAILAMFLVPLIIAVLMFSGHLPLLSGETVNRGKLIQPPVALDWTIAQPIFPSDTVAELQDSWVILMPLPSICDQACFQKVAGLRQVHKASGREQDRLELVLLTQIPVDEQLDEDLLAIYDRFRLLGDPSGALHESLLQVTLQAGISGDSLPAYLVDPLGNIMMAYDMADSDTRLSKDLKRLLTWSKQDKT